jgi:hypothetical protein
MNQQSEANLQSKCYQWAYNTYPQLRGLIFSVPNGGTRNLREAQYLKATGLTPGIPDMILLIKGVIGIEFKSMTGKLSDQQIKIHSIWRAAGCRVEVINNEEAFKELIKSVV